MNNDLPPDPEFVEPINQALDKFEEEVAKLPKWTHIEVPKYLYMNVSDLAKKSPDELTEAVFMLNQYSFNVQRTINKLRAWERWCNASLDSLEAKFLEEVPPSYGFNERPKIARHKPEPCKKINEFLRKIRMQLDRLYDLPNQIKIIADSIRDIKFVALRKEKEYANSD